MKIPDDLKPPCGVSARRLAAAFTLAAGVPRLPMFDWLASIFDWFALAYTPLRFVDPWVYGVVMTLLGVAILVTSYKGRRLTLQGRVIAALGFTMWTVLTVATTSATTFLSGAAVAATMLAEVWAQRGSCDDT